MTARLALLAVLAAAAAPSAANGAVVAQDKIKAAPELTGAGPHTFTYDTDGAMHEILEAYHGGPDYDRNSVWVKWTPSKSGGVKLEGCGALKDPGTYLRMYKSTNELFPSVSSLDDVPGPDEQILHDCYGGTQIVKAIANQTYYIVAVRSKYMNTPDKGGTMTITQVTDPPKVKFDTAPTATGPKPKFTFSAPNGSKFGCKLDTGGWQPCSGPNAGMGSFSPTVTKSGGHTVTVRATDSFHNQGPEATWSFAADASGPDTFIDSPAPVYGGSYPIVKFHASEATGVTFRCEYEGVVKQPCTSPWQMSSVPKIGSHEIEVTAYDKWGNADPSPAVQAFTIEAPPLPPKPPYEPAPTPAPAPTAPTPPATTPATPVAPNAHPTANAAGPCVTRVTHGRLTRRGMRVRIAGDAKRLCTVTLTLHKGRRLLARVVRPVPARIAVSLVVRPKVKAPRRGRVSLASVAR